MIENSSKGKGGDEIIKSEKLLWRGTGSSSSSSSRLSSEWLRNPRIVRVSRALGGKDRHSKVCTVRGLRDRRIRLSVPTAIQLYDLQERLGLSQPSKVVDWLLEAAKSDIDKLPPLHINPAHCNFPQFQSLVPPPPPRLDRSDHLFSLGGAGSFFDANHQNLNNNVVVKSRCNNNNNNHLDLDVNSSSLLKGKQVENSGYCLMNNNLSQFGSNGLLFPNSNSHHHHQQQQQQQVANRSSSPSQLLFCPPSSSSDLMPSFMESDLHHPPKQYSIHGHILHQILSSPLSNSSSSSSSLQVMTPPPPPNHVLFQSLHSSPLRRLPTLFSSKLLDLDPNSNTRSQPDKSDAC